MIACTMNRVAPLVIGDLLISDSIKPDQFILPVLTEDVFQYLSNVSEFHPIRLDQKIYILKSNVCIAFAGKVYYIKQFLEDISMFCKIHDSVNAEKIQEFMEEHQHDDSWEHFSFILLVIDKQDDHLRLGSVKHGDWVRIDSEVFGEVFASGSGSMEFLKESVSNVKIRSHYSPNDISYILQVNIIMISRLLAKERLTLDSVKQHWGAGFEMIYFDKDHFTKLDNITYVINQGLFNDDGDIVEVPVPGIILHYKYFGEILVITVIRPYKGTTETSENKYVIRSQELNIMRFVVVPMNYKGSEDFVNLAKNPSFTSERNAMAYLIETNGGHYIPASFNEGHEVKVEYKYPDSLTITMHKEINDILKDEAKVEIPL